MIFKTQQRKSGWGSALALVAVAAIGSFFWQHSVPAAAETGATVPPAKATLQESPNGMATTVLAGGCFWGMEEVFQHVAGVKDVVSGYAGGSKAHANYSDSSSGRYGDAEAVRISYDPSRISYAELLRIYFSVAHDPTQVDRQGPDTGAQYRSEVFTANADQEHVARAYIQQLTDAKVFDQPIATKVSTGENFFPAEDYHQNYARRHPNSFYIRINDAPKVAALKKHFPKRYREQPDELAAN